MNYDAIIRDLQERVSYLERNGAPQHVQLTDYFATSTIVGWSSISSGTIYYTLDGKKLFLNFVLIGPSNSTAASFTIPYTAANIPYFNSAITVGDNGVIQAAPGRARINANTNIVNLYLTMNTTTGLFTASGTKSCAGQLWCIVQ